MVVNGSETKNGIKVDLIDIQGSLGVVFLAFIGYLFLARVSVSFHIHAKTDFFKKKVILFKPKFKPITLQYQSKCTTYQ